MIGVSDNFDMLNQHKSFSCNNRGCRKEDLKMNRKEFSFRGLMAPVFTPFNEDKEINWGVIPEYAKYLSEEGIQGILVNGTTGEGVSLTTKERKDVLEEWLKASHMYNQTIMVQVGGTNTKDVKELAKHAEELGVAAILCLPDLFFRPVDVNDLLRYLNIISAAAPRTPLLYYHIPRFTGVNLNMKEFIEKSAKVPTLVGIKFTDNDLDIGGSCVSDRKHSVFLGADSLILPALIQGFDSVIGTTINMFPHLNLKILRYFNTGDFESATKEQQKLNHNIQEITKLGTWVSSMKAVMGKLTGINVGPVRDPLVDVDIRILNLNLY